MSAYSKCTNATRQPARRLWKLRADGDDADRVPSATLKLADGVRKVRARAGCTRGRSANPWQKPVHRENSEACLAHDWPQPQQWAVWLRCMD